MQNSSTDNSSSSENEDKLSNYQIGHDDVNINFGNKISTEQHPIKGNYTTPEDLQQILKNKKKSKKKIKNRGIMSDDIRPGGRDNEPDPDHFDPKINSSFN